MSITVGACVRQCIQCTPTSEYVRPVAKMTITGQLAHGKASAPHSYETPDTRALLADAARIPTWRGRPLRRSSQLYGSAVGSSIEFPTLATVII